jgi:hypothetical protein
VFNIPEIDLALKSGIARDNYKQARKQLVRGIHWQTVGGEVRYTEEGATKAFEVICGENNPPPATDVPTCGSDETGKEEFQLGGPQVVESVETPAPDDLRGELPKPAVLAGEIIEEITSKKHHPAKVIRIYPNPRMIEADIAGVGSCRVTVPESNKNFRVGMEIKAEPGPYNDVWILVGRSPRYPGRW